MVSVISVAPPTLAADAAALASMDSDLAALVARLGLPTFPLRPPGFLTLLTLILEQQVSTASALAVRNRLLEVVPDLTPRHFLQLDAETLRRCGFSRQKAGYVRGLAAEIESGRFALEDLAAMPDETAQQALVRLKGIGRWTAEVYLLFALGRPDVWPAGDLAVQVGVGLLKRLPSRPGEMEVRAIGEAWRPFRSSVAVLLWHFYLSDRLGGGNRSRPKALPEAEAAASSKEKP